MSEMGKWEILESRMAFEHEWYKVRRDTVRLPDGKIIDDYFISVRPDVALIFPVTEDGKVVMVRQYKHAAGEIVEELPGGFFNPLKEGAGEAATRELLEETGFSPGSPLELLATVFTNPTKDTSKAHLFLARNVKPEAIQDLDVTEDIEVFTLTLEEVKTRVLKGDFPAGDSLSAAFLGLSKLGLIR